MKNQMVNINNQNHKLAIVGISINCDSYEGLDKFERIIYEGKQESLPLQRGLEITKIINNALKNAGVDTKTKIAVITTTDEEDTTRISQTEFNNLPFTHTAASKTVFSAIKMAQKLLNLREVDAVLIVSHAAALVLKLYTDAEKNNQRVYATIDALTLPQNSSPKAQTITQSCQQAFNIAGVKPEDIGYLEICSSSILEPNQLEIKELVAAYQTSTTDNQASTTDNQASTTDNKASTTELSCAIGSLKSNTCDDFDSDIASLIKTALCLYYRYIPAVPQWSTPKYIEQWQGSPFYVATQSKPWFLPAGANQRVAAINSFSDGNLAHLILSEAPLSQERDSRYLAQMPYYLFPLAADEPSVLLEKIEALEKTISQSDTLAVTAAQTFAIYQEHQNANYAVGIIGRNHKELQRETQRALKGVKNAFETGEDWKTPVGSYFTAKPLGKKGKVAFVYPGAYSSYTGIARNLFRLFPKIWDSPIIKSIYARVANIEKLLYPRSLKAFTKRQLEALEQQLIDNPLSMLESEVGIAALMSEVLKDYFGLQPQCCFGYSVGEISMAMAQGIWTDIKQISSGLNSSELFTTRLSGCKNAVREYWGLADEEVREEFWGNFVLMAEVSQVKEYLKNEQRVYLTQINTPNEVVIAGDTAACQRIIAAIGCNAIPAPFNHAIHCEAMASEYDELVKLYTLPVESQPKIDFYSAADYGLLNLDSEVMGHSIAKVLCGQFDFPRMINRLYADNARIFVEMGAGNTCSRWIGENLKGREHTTLFMNRRGIDEHTTLLRGLAQLLSHGVSLDLSPLYEQKQHVTIPHIKDEINNKNQEQMISLSPHYWGKFSMEEWHTLVKFNGANSQFLDFLNYEPTNTIDKIFPKQINMPSIDKQLNRGLANDKLSIFFQSHAQKLSETNQESNQAHAAFLKTRQSSFEQMVKIVEFQLSVLSPKNKLRK